MTTLHPDDVFWEALNITGLKDKSTAQALNTATDQSYKKNSEWDHDDFEQPIVSTGSARRRGSDKIMNTSHVWCFKSFHLQ